VQFICVNRKVNERLTSSSIINSFESEHTGQCGQVWERTTLDHHIYTDKIESRGNESYSYDGYFFSDKLEHWFYSNFKELNFTDVFANAETLSGNFSILKVNIEQNLVEIKPDVFGQNPVFYYDDENYKIISNNQQLVRSVLRQLGVKVEMNPMSVVFNVSYLSAFNNISPYREIRVLAPRSMITLRAGNISTHEYCSLKEFLHSDVEYDVLVDKICEDIKHRSNAIIDFALKYNAHCIADLSGGVDSRMVLASFLSTGRHKELKYFCVNNSHPTGVSTDRQVADDLMDKYGLSFGEGVTETSSSTASLVTCRGVDAKAKISRGILRYFGLLPYAFEDFGDTFMKNYIRVGGYCGEFTRAPGPNLGKLVNTENLNVESVTDSFFNHCTQQGKNNASVVLTDIALKEIRAEFFKYFSKVMSATTAPGAINALTYIENRAKHHFGLRSSLGNNCRVSITPIIDYRIPKLYQKMKYGEHFDNKIAFDIINKLGGVELAMAPFAEFRWSRNALGNLADDYILSCQVVKNISSDLTNKNFHLNTKLTSKNNSELLANGVDGLSGKKLESSAGTLEILIKCFDCLSEDDQIWNYLNRCEVKKIISQQSIVDDVNTVRLVSSLLFYMDINIKNEFGGVMDGNLLFRNGVNE
jgi:hypothetical protein